MLNCSNCNSWYYFDHTTNPHPHPTDSAHKIRIRRKRILAGSVTSLITTQITLLDDRGTHGEQLAQSCFTLCPGKKETKMFFCNIFYETGTILIKFRTLFPE